MFANLLMAAVSSPVFGVITKITLVLLAGWCVAASLRRGTAAARHYVWLLTLAGSLCVAIPARLPFHLDVPVAGLPAATAPVVGEPIDAATPDAATPAEPTPSWSGTPVPSRPEGSHAPLLNVSLRMFWLTGAALAIAWQLLGHFFLWRLARAAAPVRDAAWLGLLERARTERGMGPVALRSSPAIGSPLVYGIVRPVILLPVDAGDWSEQRRRVVVLHELAHITRRDALSQLLAGLACALWWFHPGVWFAALRMRAESERACDDRVVASGVPALDYASHLLGVARGARALRLTGAVAIAMARRSTLEGRLLAMLDGRRRTAELGRVGRVVGASALAVTLIAFAVVRLVATDAVAETKEAWVAADAPVAADLPALADLDAATKSETPDPKPLPALQSLAALTAVKEEGQGTSDEGSPFRDAVEAQPGDTLVLDLETGGTVTIRGWSQNRVQVDGVLDGEDWEQTRTEIARKGRRVVFRSVPDENANTERFSTSHRFDFRVPKRFNVKLRSAGGKVTITDLEGTMTGYSGGGGFVLERLKGRARLNTGGGPVIVTDVDMSGSVTTGGGPVRLSRIRGGLKGTSGSGPVIKAEGDVESDPDGPSGDLDGLEVDAKSGAITTASGSANRGRLRIDKAGGPIKIDQAPDGIHATTGGGKITIGPSARDVDISTGGGDIEIGPASGSVSATTGAGEVHLVLTKSSERDREVTVWSGKGTIVLELARGVGVTLDLEAAYTDGFGRKSTIRSDVPVDINVSDDWDMTQGTPRKYVRAQATHGDGSVHVKLHTVNGDIVIRRK